MNKIKIIIFLISLLLIAFSYWYLRPREISIPNAIATNTFNDKYLIPLRKDSLSAYLERRYGADISIKDKNKFTIRLERQGQALSKFYNNNELLINNPKLDFSIKPNPTEGSLEASFNQEERDSTTFVLLPTDVAMGIIKSN